MPVPNEMAVDFTAEELTDFDAALETMIDMLNGKIQINLTDEERKAVRSVAEGRRPYVEKTYTMLAPANTQFHPPFLRYDHQQTNYSYSTKLRNRFPRIKQLLEIAEEHAFCAEHHNFRWMLKFYGNAQDGSEMNIPGSDTVIAELAPLFAQENNHPPAPPPPVEP